jgi:quinol-cytochrome oxidoreductase complex cytochrome b subunit
MSAQTEKPVFKSGVTRWIDDRLPLLSWARAEFVDYPAPKNLNYWWNFGSLASIMLVIMIFSGLFLTMHYVPHTDYAFSSIEHIMRDVNYGWLMRYIHSNGASMFFIVVYIHMFRGLYYGSYKEPRELLWILGVVILLLMMATAFMGYVLPWGQMSFWGAMVITNLFSAIPLFGDAIVTWLWGGFTVDNPTLNRFFALHYLMPFVIFAVVFLHILALHQFGSNNPVGIDVSKKDKIPFHPYYTIKDMFGFCVFFIFYGAFVFFMPEALGHAENYIPADPLVTPPHIVPEWYFLPFYAILRAITFDIFWIIPAKLGGVIAMFAAIAVLFFLPWLDTSKVRSARFRPIYKLFFWLFVANAFLLGYVGAMPAEGIWPTIGLISTAYYFVFFVVVMPLLGRLEKPLPLPASINEPVLPRSGGAAAQPAE